MNYYQSKLAYEMDSADLYEALGREEPIVVVDGARRRRVRARAHSGRDQPSAQDISANSTGPLDKSKLYVCYCDGIGCNASTKTALKLLTLGFQVRELIGGLDWWRRDGYATHGSEGRTANGSGAGAVERRAAR